MSADELEALLARLPLRPLGSRREARLLRALLAADLRRQHWWERPVRAWQAAACVALAVLAVLPLRVWSQGSPSQVPLGRTPPPVVVSVEPSRPLFQPRRTEYALDIRRWQARAMATHGERE